jgi:hypothetical protein
MWLEKPRYVKVYKSREDGSLWYHQLNAQEAHPFNPDETVFYLEKDVDDLMAGIDIVIQDKVKFLEESTEAWKKEFAEKADEKLREKEEFMVEMLQIATKKFVEQELCGELTEANKEAIKFLISESLAQVEDKLKKRGELDYFGTSNVQAKTDEPRPMIGDSVRLNLCKESIDNIAKTLKDAYPS